MEIDISSYVGSFKTKLELELEKGIPNSKVYCELTIEKERACSLEIIDNELQVSKDSDIAHLSPESCRVFLSLKEENKIPEVFE